MGDPVDVIKDVGLNLVTGGLYSVGKGLAATIKSGNPTDLLSQGLDLGMGALGQDLALDVGGKSLATAYNLAGVAGGMAGGGLSALSPTGFGAEAGTAPLATEGLGATGVTTATGEAASPEALLSSQSGLHADGVVSQTGMGGTGGAGAAETAPQGLVQTEGSQVPSLAENFGKDALSVRGTPGVSSDMLKAAKDLEGAASTEGWWNSLSPAVKGGIVTGGIFAGGQMVTGGLGGLFAGLSAQKQLELQKLINQQSQNAMLYTRNNNTYAPTLTFAQTPAPPASPQPGLINMPKVP